MIITKRVFLLAALFVLFLTQKTFASTDTAKSYCVMNSVTGEIVEEKSPDETLPMASTTKIATLLVAVENSSPEDIITVSNSAVMQEGSSAYLLPEAKITMRDLCYGLMLNSGNDAAVVIAEHISGNQAEFAKLMNSVAKKAGAKNTNYVNPNGLPDENHYTTATDMARLTRYALKNKEFRKIVSTVSYTSTMTMPDGEIKKTPYLNHNRLLRELDGCIGVKTGFTEAAGRCLVSAVNRDGAEYIIVTLNDSDDWNTHKELCEKAFNGKVERKIIKKGDCIKHIKSGKEECSLIAKKDFSVAVNGGKNDFEVVKCLPKTMNFPLNKGEKVGYVNIKANGEIIGTVDMVSEKDFYPKSEKMLKNCFWFAVLIILRNLI